MTVKDYVLTYPSKIKDKLSNSAGVATVALPMGALLETAVTGMSDVVSGQSRFYGALFTTVIVPSVLDLREYSRNYFSANEGMRKKVHDGLFYFTVGAAYKVVAYIASGENDIGRIALGTLLTSVGTSVVAPVLLGAGDLFESAYGKISVNLSKKTKNIRKMAATAVLAGSIALTTAVYSKDWPAQNKSLDDVVQEVSYSVK